MSENRGRVRFIIVGVILLVVFNVIAFAIPFEKNTTFWIGYVFSDIAILITLAASAYAFSGNKQSRFYGLSLIYLSWIYMVFQLVLSIVLMTASNMSYQWALIPCVLLLAAYLIGLIAADASKEYIEKADNKIKSDTVFIRSLQLDVQNILASTTNKDIVNAVKGLSEEIRYSDPVSISQMASVEAQISDDVERLRTLAEEGDVNSAKKQVDLIKKELSHRNEKMKLLK